MTRNETKTGCGGCHADPPGGASLSALLLQAIREQEGGVVKFALNIPRSCGSSRHVGNGSTTSAPPIPDPTGSKSAQALLWQLLTEIT